MIQQEEIARLGAFHAAHFPGQPIPESTKTQQPDTGGPRASYSADIDNDELGYYHDGVKRTLTDEQVKMFRHSEIQRLLSERQALREKEDLRKNSKEDSHNSSTTRDPRKRRFDDEPSTDHLEVDTLMYDDELESLPTSGPTEKKFLWPLLGQQK